MSTEPADRSDLLIERAAGADRERRADGRILPSAAWFDLSPEERDRLYEIQMNSRAIERILDPQGLSTTSRAVLERIAGIGQG